MFVPVPHETTTPPPLTAEVEALERDIAALGAGLASALARWLVLVGEFDALGAALLWGFRGTGDWLAWRCGISARAAREHVRVARRLRELPHLRAAFEAGELSYSKVRAVTRAAEWEHESMLLELARESTADQLERSIRALRSAPSADPEQARSAHERRRVDWSWASDGSLQVFAHLPADDGAALIEALETAAEAIGGESGRGRGARRADALAEIVHSGCPRTQVVLHVDEIALACTARGPKRRAGEVCTLRDGPAIASETARRLTCEADVVNPDSGRRRRVVSPALRAALERRDRGCRWPGCDRRHGLQAHHVTHWIHGGATDRDNLVLVCRFHHHLVHEAGFTVDGRSGELEFRAPDGRLLSERPPSPVGQNARGDDADLRHRPPQPGHGLHRSGGRLRGASGSPRSRP